MKTLTRKIPRISSSQLSPQPSVRSSHYPPSYFSSVPKRLPPSVWAIFAAARYWCLSVQAERREVNWLTVVQTRARRSSSRPIMTAAQARGVKLELLMKMSDMGDLGDMCFSWPVELNS